MPRTEEQNIALRKRRKTKILKGSLFLFASQGFDASTIEDIANASGMAHGLIYHYYSSKDELLGDLITTYGVKFSEETERLKGISPYNDDSLDELLSCYIDILNKSDELCAYIKMSLESSYKTNSSLSLDWQKQAISSIIPDLDKADLLSDILSAELDKRLSLGKEKYSPFNKDLVAFLLK